MVFPDVTELGLTSTRPKSGLGAAAMDPPAPAAPAMPAMPAIPPPDIPPAPANPPDPASPLELDEFVDEELELDEVVGGGFGSREQAKAKNAGTMKVGPRWRRESMRKRPPKMIFGRFLGMSSEVQEALMSSNLVRAEMCSSARFRRMGRVSHCQSSSAIRRTVTGPGTRL